MELLRNCQTEITDCYGDIMQIKRLSIHTKRCLSDFYVQLYTPNQVSTTILIGENGAGKSTMMEAILEILLSFDSPATESRINYDYVLEYEYAQKDIHIAKSWHNYYIDVDGEVFEGSYSALKNWLKGQRIFPKRIITFYSGANNKLEPQIRKIKTEFKKQYRTIMRGYLWVKNNVAQSATPPIPVRKYNLCDEQMVPIYLCSILGGPRSYEKKYLIEQCGFDFIARFLMIVDLDKVEKLFGNKRFEGEYPHHLLQVAEYIDPEMCEYLRRGWLYASKNKGYFEIEELRDCGVNPRNIMEFFQILQDLFDAEYETYISIGNRVVTSSDLSEGQRQLIKMLGMLGICKNEDCLILLDEPDAHMNPQWKYGIKKIMDGCLEEAQNAQAIIATHDPLVINGVPKEFIRIFENTEGRTTVHVPTEDTAGMGIDGLLQSQYYGLNSTLDADTQSLLEEKRNLMVKRKHGDLTVGEWQRLHELTDKLESMDFSRNIPADNYYDEFVVAMQSAYEGRPRPVLTPEEIEERNRMAREIAESLIGQ